MEIIKAVCEGFLIGFKYTGIGIGFIVGICCGIFVLAMILMIIDKISDKFTLKRR